MDAETYLNTTLNKLFLQLASEHALFWAGNPRMTLKWARLHGYGSKRDIKTLVTEGRMFHVTGVEDAPSSFTVSTDLDMRYLRRLRPDAVRESLSGAANLSGDSMVGVGRYGNKFQIIIPKPDGLCWSVSDTMLPLPRRLSIPAGLNADVRPVRVNFGYELSSHMLVAGTTGSGKTTFAKHLVSSLVEGNHIPTAAERRAGFNSSYSRLFLVDVAKSGMHWKDFDSVPHLAGPVVSDMSTLRRVLAWAIQEIGRRGEERSSTPHIFLFLDEAHMLLEDNDEVVKSVSHIAKMGREMGIHLVLILQDPQKEQIGDTAIRNNITTRVVFRVADDTAARVAAGRSHVAAHTDLRRAGDAYFVLPDGVERGYTPAFDTRRLDGLPRTEAIPDPIDLSSVPDEFDLDRMTSVVERGNNKDPIEAYELAAALALPDVGINKLAGFIRKKIGSGPGGEKATDIREYADEIQAYWKEWGVSPCSDS